MPDKKLTDKEIVNALECCLDVSPSTCKNCPLFNITNSTMVCSKIAAKFALDLIKRLQAENKRLSTLAELGNTRANDYRVMRDRALKAEAEVERLKTNLNVELENFATEYDNKIKAEAIKEFAERLKDKITMSPHSFISIDKWYIDNLVKEMVGEEK